MMRLLIMGPPGAGKGTQARKIAEHYRIPAVSTGDIFRANVSQGTSLGHEVQRIMAAGGYVDDDITNAIVANRLVEDDAADGHHDEEQQHDDPGAALAVASQDDEPRGNP